MIRRVERTACRTAARWLLICAVGPLLSCTATQKGGLGPPGNPNLPVIALSSAALSFSGVGSGVVDPAPQTVTITNSGASSLTGLAVGPAAYPANSAVGWINSVTLSGTSAPATVTVAVSAGGLVAGTYSARIDVMSSVTGVRSATVTITFTVTPPPTITPSADNLTFGGTPGGPNPPAQTINITNSGTGSLTGLSLGTTVYGAGQPTGWLSTSSLAGTSAPTTLTVRPNIAGLSAGTYTALVAIQTSLILIPDDTVAVTLTLSGGPVITLSTASASFQAIQGGTLPAPQALAVTNTGTGTLNGLSATTAYTAAQPTGWLTASLNTTIAPATLTLTANQNGLAKGLYSATVTVASTVSGVSSQQLTVTFNVTAQPSIALSQTSVSFGASVGGANPSPQTLAVTNGGSGSLTGLAVAPIVYTGTGGWLTATLAGTSAATTLSLSANGASLGAGNYGATVTITSSQAGVASKSVNVVFSISAATATYLSVISGSGQSGYTNTILVDSLVVRAYDVSGAPLTGIPITWTAGQGGSLVNAQTASGVNGEAFAKWLTGTLPGTQTVTASAPGALSAVFTANVSVPTGGYPNEPAGFAKETERPFDAKIEDGWLDNGHAGFQLAQDPTAIKSAPGVGVMNYPAGWVGGVSPDQLSRTLSQQPSIYISFWFMMSANWVGHKSGVNKVIYAWIGQPLQPQVYFSAQHPGTGDATPSVHLQGLDVDPQGGARNLNPNRNGSKKIVKGQWARVEILLRSNTGNNADGVAQCWVDGILVIDYHDVGYTTSTAGKGWGYIQWAPVWGGVQDTLPTPQSMFMDHLYVSGGP